MSIDSLLHLPPRREEENFRSFFEQGGALNGAQWLNGLND